MREHPPTDFCGREHLTGEKNSFLVLLINYMIVVKVSITSVKQLRLKLAK
jgi:hypothetical protein